MTQPNHSSLRWQLDHLASALLSLEIELTGFRFDGDTAEEVNSLAQRLADLAKPNKGRDDLGPGTFPSVEIDRAA